MSFWSRIRVTKISEAVFSTSSSFWVAMRMLSALAAAPLEAVSGAAMARGSGAGVSPGWGSGVAFGSSEDTGAAGARPASRAAIAWSAGRIRVRMGPREATSLTICSRHLRPSRSTSIRTASTVRVPCRT